MNFKSPQLALALPFLLLFGWARTQEGEPPPLRVTYLANEGFLLSAGSSDVLIDAFVSLPYAGYSALPEEVYADLVATRAPFDDIELALVSHAHGDHFQPEPARAFLGAAKSTWLISSPRVVADLGEPDPSFAGRVRALLPATGKTTSLHHEGIDVELWRLRHSGQKDDSLQNLGHLIDLEGHTIVHVGDAAMDPDLYAPYARDEPFDLALVPYWYWSSSAGRKLLEGPLRAHRTIAIHIPPRDLQEFVDAMELDYPAVGVPKEALDAWDVEASPQ